MLFIMGFKEGIKRGAFRVVTTIIGFWAILGSVAIYFWQSSWKLAVANLVVSGVVMAFLEGYAAQYQDEE